MTAFYVYCPNSNTPVPPPIEEQINREGRQIWAPNTGFCQFRHIGPGTERLVTINPRAAWPSQTPRLWSMGSSQYISTYDSATIRDLIIENYRCVNHGNPPQVFRQSAAYYRRTETLTRNAYLQIPVGRPAHDGSPGIPWPDFVPEENRWRRVSIYRLRPGWGVPGTHEFWTSR